MDDKTHSASTQAGPSVAPKLEIIAGEEVGQSFKLKLKTTIGRERDNDVTLLDLKASRYHAQISLQGGQWLLEDLGSANGTFLNDVAVTAGVSLQNGDQITVGETMLAFRAPARSGVESSAAKPSPTQAPASVPAPAATPPTASTQPRVEEGTSSRPPRLAWIAGGVICWFVWRLSSLFTLLPAVSGAMV